MIISSKKKGSAVVEFATVRAAVSTQLFPSQCPYSVCSIMKIFSKADIYREPHLFTTHMPRSLRSPAASDYDLE